MVDRHRSGQHAARAVPNDDGGQPHRLHHPLSPGQAVEVWNDFSETWCGRFQVAGVTESGYQLRRESEPEALPGEMRFDDVRPH